MKSLRRLVCLGMVVLAGCGALQPSPTIPQAVEPQLLISVAHRGGLCSSAISASGSMRCSRTTDILTDGMLTVRMNEKKPKTTMLSSDELATLTTLVNSTDFTAVKAVPFTGVCPTSHDLFETFYTFVTAHGTEELANCRVAIDGTLPLFQTLWAILKKYE